MGIHNLIFFMHMSTLHSIIIPDNKYLGFDFSLKYVFSFDVPLQQIVSE